MTKPPLVTISIIGLIALSLFKAGAADVQGTAENTVVRYKENVGRAETAIAAGDKAFKDKNYDVAVVDYQTACAYLPESPLTHTQRGRAIDGFSQASVRLAEQRIVEGRFADAEAAAKGVAKYNPNYKPALQLLANLEDPTYYNTTVGKKFYDRVQLVKQYFIDAKGYYDSGRYDLSYKRCDQILDLDPYNSAARQMQEKINAAKLRYYEEAYNTTRSYLSWQVEQHWAIKPRQYLGHEIIRSEPVVSDIRNTEYIQNKLNHIIIPRIEFREATVRDAIEFLKRRSAELDTTETDPTRKGVNIVLKLDTAPGLGAPPAALAPAPGAPPADPTAGGGLPPAAVAPAFSPDEAKITLLLSNIPLAEALRYITDLAGLKVKVEPYAVTIVPLSEPTDQLVTKEYKVPPGFLGSAGAAPGGSGALAPARPGGGLGGAGGGLGGGGTGAVGTPVAPSALPKHITALDYLTQLGVVFPPGASANFIAASSKLVVRNTEENLDLVDQIVESSYSTQPTQVNIESKFVEIQQTNYKELSFDYSLGTGNIGNIEYSGGNTGGPTTTFPFTNIVGGGQISSGLRSGNNAITGDSVDALLSGVTGNGPAPATFALAGVVTTAQFQAVIRALNQKKGVDLLSAPSVTTKSGARAVIEIVQEFRYPTEFTAPQVPPAGPAPLLGGGGGGAGGFTPITPNTPTAFETRNTGVTLEVEPVIGPDNQTIDLNLSPQVVEFDGFINYGQPIYGPPQQAFTVAFAPVTGIPIQIPIGGLGPQTIETPNVINQPIFDTRKVTTSVTIWDGATVIIGGLVREDVQSVEDKIPGLGDLPIIGRMFRSNVDQHIKRNLVMFVTAHLENPAGELVHEDEEKEEDVVPLTAPDLIPPPSLPEAPLPK